MSGNLQVFQLSYMHHIQTQFDNITEKDTLSFAHEESTHLPRRASPVQDTQQPRMYPTLMQGWQLGIMHRIPRLRACCDLE